MEEARVGIPSYDDDEFVDAVAQAYGKVSGAHLIVEENVGLYLDTEWDVVNVIDDAVIATFSDETYAVWFVQAHSNQPRVNDLLRKSMDQAEEAERRYDELVQTIVFGGAK